MKAKKAIDVKNFEDIPNVGPQMSHDFHLLNIRSPKNLKNKNPYILYMQMCTLSGVRQDPCVLDTYIAAIDFMNGAPARPWWYYTTRRKEQYPDI